MAQAMSTVEHYSENFPEFTDAVFLQIVESLPLFILKSANF